jgi:alcohol dehydrogenase, propanol-preferring
MNELHARGRAMRLPSPGGPLAAVDLAPAPPGEHEVLIDVAACGVCRTDLHLLDGELPQANYPVIPGHEIVGHVRARGAAVTAFQVGERVGVPWLARTCGRCRYCLARAENLCDRPTFTGCNADGGFATHAVADARFCLRIPAQYSDAEAAPLLCAGLIGYRAYRACGDSQNIGLYGFGAAAHILAQLAVAEGRKIFAFTRPGDLQGQQFARDLGAQWAGDSEHAAPRSFDAAIIFAPVGALVPVALRAVRKGGRVITAGIHMSDIPSFPYEVLWGERSVASVANLTRADGREFMEIAARVRLRPSVERFPLEQANEALARLRAGELQGAAVLVMNHHGKGP